MDIIDYTDNTGYKASNKTGKYNTALFRYVSDEAKKRNLNPMVAKAMLMVETAGGKKTDNPLQIDYKRSGMPVPDYKGIARQRFYSSPGYQTILEANVPTETRLKALKGLENKILEATVTAENVKSSLDYLKKGYKKYPTDHTKAIQFYNGEGYIKPKYASAYNMTGLINAKENPVYGKKVLKYLEDMKRQGFEFK